VAANAPKTQRLAAGSDTTAGDEARVGAVLGSIQDGIVLIDGSGNVERINAVAESQLGISAANAVGRPLATLGLAAVDASVHESLRSGSAAGPIDVTLQHDGDASVLACTMQPFTDTSGSRGMALALRDVSGQREFDHMCSEFVLRASHELRTPIASVRMGLGLLGEKLDFPMGSRDRELYDTVQHELTRMVELLSDLLDLSRLRLGEELEFTDIEVGELVGDAQQRYAAAADKAGIQLHSEIEDGLPTLSICRSAIDRVLNNLIAGALGRTPASGSIALAARRKKTHVVLTIADTGDAIAMARQNVAFEPFSQPSAKRHGAGLGLAICREIVRRHGGEIEIYSRPRKGTRFTITLPVPKSAPS
jgi:NtrC-family two-component system sensor histidine kinase KinB